MYQRNKYKFCKNTQVDKNKTIKHYGTRGSGGIGKVFPNGQCEEKNKGERSSINSSFYKLIFIVFPDKLVKLLYQKVVIIYSHEKRSKKVELSKIQRKRLSPLDISMKQALSEGRKPAENPKW
jgi:hypothetical protein